MATNKLALKILVVRFSSIGDIVLTTPIVRMLHQQLKAEVHFLCKEHFRPIVEANPYITRSFGIRQSPGEVWKLLKAEHYDYIIDLHKNLRSRRFLFFSGPKVLTFDKINIHKWLLTTFGINRLPNIHIVDRYLKAVEPLGVKDDGKGLDYFIPPTEEVDLLRLAPGFKAGQYIALAIGAAHATKRLPQHKILELCQLLNQPVILLGGKGEREVGKAIATELPSILNLCGQLSLHQSASIIRQAGGVITHDTGMMHIAAAFHKKILSVWGNTIPAFGMYPYYGQAIDQNQSFQVEGLRCRPCSKIGYASCPKGHFRCMQDQDLPAIARAASALHNK